MATVITTSSNNLNLHKPYPLRKPKTPSQVPFVSRRLTAEKTRFKSSKISSSNRPDPEPDKTQVSVPEEEVDSVGVKVALSMLSFYKREISPLMPRSCRYVPSCSEYSMEAYKRYGVVKGTVLTAWRLCRCNPLGGSGFDPPRWFGEEAPPLE